MTDKGISNSDTVVVRRQVELVGGLRLWFLAQRA